MQLEKETKMRRGVPRRGYDDACGTAHALELIGERWALLVLRELLLGPRRFSDLRGDLPAISANVLTQRLKELESRRLVRRRKLPPPASVQVYEATDWGLEAAPVMRALGRWAVRSTRHDTSQFVSPVSILMSMQTMLVADRARGFKARIGFRFGERFYVADLHENRLDVRHGQPEATDVVFNATPEELAAVLYGGAPLDSLLFSGDRSVAERFTTLFELPPKVA